MFHLNSISFKKNSKITKSMPFDVFVFLMPNESFIAPAFVYIAQLIPDRFRPVDWSAPRETVSTLRPCPWRARYAVVRDRRLVSKLDILLKYSLYQTYKNRFQKKQKVNTLNLTRNLIIIPRRPWSVFDYTPCPNKTNYGDHEFDAD